ncbi:MAG: hypothetical protein Q9223_002109 [Gallowayella weberi]
MRANPEELDMVGLGRDSTLLNALFSIGRLVITINNNALNLKNGSSMILLPEFAGTAMRACLSPDYPLMSLSEDIFRNFISATGYRGAYPDRSVPDISGNARGFLTFTNTSSREVLLNSLQDVSTNDMPLLRRLFLSSAYLFVDDDHQQFVLWNANPTASEKRLVPVGPITPP